MSRVRERPSTSEAHNDFWCGMSGVHAGGDAKLLIKFAWPKRRHNFGTKRFKEKSLFMFHARIALK